MLRRRFVGVFRNSDGASQEAAKDERVAAEPRLNGTTTPTTTHTEMVYRLLLLAVLAESDRNTNNGACFGNTMLDTVELCANAETARPCRPGPQTPRTPAQNIHGKRGPFQSTSGRRMSTDSSAPFIKTETGTVHPEETLRARYDHEELTNLADASSLRYSDASSPPRALHSHTSIARARASFSSTCPTLTALRRHPVGFAGDAGGFFIDLFYNLGLRTCATVRATS